jgi:hypothetical protein
VRNSANTGDLLSVRGNGNVQVGINGLSICRADTVDGSLLATITYPSGDFFAFNKTIATSTGIYGHSSFGFTSVSMNLGYSGTIFKMPGAGTGGFEWEFKTGATALQGIFKITNNTTSVLEVKQSNNVLIGTSTDVASSILTLSSTTKGFLPPVMSSTQRDAITSPATGLIVFNNDLKSLDFYGGSSWISDASTTITNRQTASYTIALSDKGKLVEMNVATANNLTVPLNSSTAFPIGTKIDVVQYGDGQTTIVAASGVVLRSANNWLKINAKYGAVSLIKIATDEWYVFGNLNA